MLLLALLGALWVASSPSGSCAPNLELKLGKSAPAQGSVFLLNVESTNPISRVTGSSDGEALHFWKEPSARAQGEPKGSLQPSVAGGGAPATKERSPGASVEVGPHELIKESANRYRALLGIDVEKRPKSYPIAVEVVAGSGHRYGCTVSVAVVDGRFAVERLRVDSKYVELSAKDLARTQEENRRLARIYASVSPERYWQSGFRPPLEGVAGSGSFGKRRVLNGKPRSPHNGEDFPAPKGKLIQAAAGGRVVLAEDLFLSGNTVVLDHGLGLFTIYAHLDSIDVRADSTVEAGASLGRVGATGRVTGPHLHWAARLGRARVNPLDLLALP